MNEFPLVAIVILNYNGKSYLEKFLPGVLSSTYPNSKIIVADNGSSDDSLLFLQNSFPDIHCIKLNQNYGFAEGYNQALKVIQADYFVLLNSDVEVVKNWIEPIVKLLQENKQIAVCQPKILSYANKLSFEYAGGAGGWIDYLGYPFARGRIFAILEKDKQQYENTIDIFWATGAAMFVRADVYKDLGGLYGFFFAHQEEIDFCWRAQNAGYKIACCTQSVVYHVGGGTLPKGHRKTFLNFRNNLIMLSRNLPLREKLWKIPLRLFLDGVFAIKCLLSKDLTSVKAIWQAHMGFYRWNLSQKTKAQHINKRMKSLSGVYGHSIIWQYYFRGKKYFEEFFK